MDEKGADANRSHPLMPAHSLPIHNLLEESRNERTSCLDR